VTRHPGIYQVGVVAHHGDTTTISGWGLCPCSSRCTCHVPLAIHQNQAAAGLLGLAKNTDCDCCVPWTADELEAVMRDMVDLATLETA
jgi:hypothetical protein